jgi:iron(III) transport system substrate-binding protein
MKTGRPRIARFATVLLVVAACGRETPPSGAAVTAPEPAEPVIVYSAESRDATTAALDSWRATGGGAFELVTDDRPEHSPPRTNYSVRNGTDLFVAGSLAEIWAVAEADALRPVFSDVVAANVAATLRDPESRWVALSRRARAVAYNATQVEPGELTGVDSYASLGDERWRGRLCVSSSTVPGNRSLLAFLIDRHGARDAEIIVRSWRDNLAIPYLADDEALLDAIGDGRCGIGIVDSAMLAAYTAGNPDTPVAVRWFADATNLLTDISAIAITRHAKQPDTARALLEWLTGAEANALFAGRRFEFPVNENAALGTAVEALAGRLPPDADYAALGFLLEEARLLAERARYP